MPRLGDNVTVRAGFEGKEITRGSKQVGKDLDRMSTSATASQKAFKSLGAVMGIAFGAEAARRVALMAGEIIKLADQSRITTKAFDALARRAGTTTAVELERMRKAVGNTISDLELMQRVGAAVDAGLTFRQAMIALQFLRRYSLAFGKDFNQLVATIFTGLQRGSVLFLDDAGIILSATDKMFAGMGDLEKKAALVGEAIRLMTVKMETLPELQDNVTVAADQSSAALENLLVTLGQPFADIVTEAGVKSAGVWDGIREGIEGSRDAMREFFREQNLEINREFGVPLEWLGMRERAFVGPLQDLGSAGQSERNFNLNRPGFQLKSPGGPGTTIGDLRLPDIIDPDVGGHGAGEPFGGVSRGLQEIRDAEVALSEARKRTEIATASSEDAEMLLLQQRHVAERESLRLIGANETQVDALKKLQKVEIDHIVKLRDKTQREADLAQVYGGATSIMSRLLPQFRGFFDAAASFAQGDMIGGIVNSIHGFLDVLGIARDSTDRLRESIEKMHQSQMRAAERGLSAIETLFGQTDLWVGYQKSAFEPFESFVGSSFLPGFELEKMRLLFKIVGDIPQELDDPAIKTAIKDSSGMMAILGNAGLTIEQFLQRLDPISGPGDTLLDVADAFVRMQAAGKQTVGVLDTVSDTIKAQFDLERLQLRRSAQAAFTAAGSDTFAQRRVMVEMRDALEEIARAEDVALRGASSTGATTGGSAAGKTTTIMPPTIMPPDPLVVHEWADVVDVTNAASILRDWPDAIWMVNKYGFSDRRNFDSWEDVIALEVIRTMPKIERDWPDAIWMVNKYGFSDKRNFDGWHDVIALEVIRTMPKIQRSWDDAIQFSRYEFGYSDHLSFAALPRRVAREVRSNKTSIKLSDMLSIRNDLDEIIDKAIASSRANRRREQQRIGLYESGEGF